MIRFKKIIMQGFKSFADRTEIEFKDGVTGIIGPNGCGKSNIGDAIKWALGEQKSSEVRVETGVDVIFMGAEGRDPAKSCEVELIFDNTERFFDIDADEVSIKRRINKKGEPERFINGQKCLLKDVKALIADRGIGRDGYSIIGQGKVKNILSDKTEDRRRVFEEAAGIATMRDQRRVSLRELDNVKSDLEFKKSLYDIRFEELNKLERKAKEAIRVRELQKQLRYFEINEYVYNLADNMKLKESYSARIKEINTEIEKLNADFMKSKDETLKAGVKANTLDMEYAALSQKKVDFAVAASNRDGEIKTLSERRKSRSGELNRVYSTKDEAIRSATENEKAIAEKLKERNTVEEKIKALDLEIESVQEELDKIIDEQIAVRGSFAENSEERDEFLKRISETKANLGKLTAELESIELRKREIVAENEDYEKKIEANKVLKTEQEKTVAVSNSEKNRYRDSYNQLARSRYETEVEKEQLNEDRIAVSAKVLALKDSISKRAAGGGALKNSVRMLLKDAEANPQISSHIKGMFSSILKIDPKYSVAIESALGAAVQHIIVGNENDATFLIDYLNKKNYGRATFLPISSMKPRSLDPLHYAVKVDKGFIGIASDIVKYDAVYSNVVLSQLGAVVVVDTKENAVAISRKYKNGFKMVTLDGTIFNTTGSITGGSEKNEAGGLLISPEAEEKLLNDSVKKQKEILERLEMLNEDISSYDTEIKRLDEVIRQTTEKINEASGRVRYIDEENLRYAQIIEKNKKLFSDISARYSEIKVNIDAVYSLDKTLAEQKGSSDENSVKARKRFDELDKQKGKKLEEKHLKEIDKKELLGKKENLSAALETLQGAVNLAKLTLATSENDIKVLTQEIAELDDKIEKMRLDSLPTDEVKKIDEQMQQVAAQKEEANKERDRLYALQERQQEQISEKKDDLNNVTSKFDLLSYQMEQAELRIKDYYDMTYDDAKAESDPFYVSSAENKVEIEKITRKIRNYGNVDFTSIDEYERSKKEVEEIDAQITDCAVTRMQLLNTIEKLEDDYVNKFTKVFNAVNNSFINIFSDIFGGGKAHLKLRNNNPDDKMDFIIDISAQPPGKSIKNLTQLSGGELTLTAIAIEFAILLLKPIPFCVLDEIDADLDETNGSLFGQYLKKMADKTQFIVVTHKKATMYKVDSLLGVTMPHRGVSVILEVKLDNINKYTDQN